MLTYDHCRNKSNYSNIRLEMFTIKSSRYAGQRVVAGQKSVSFTDIKFKTEYFRFIFDTFGFYKKTNI